MSSRVLKTLKRAAQAVVIVLLVIIPVPVGRLFARLFDMKPRATAALVVKREDEVAGLISLDSGHAPRK